MILPSTLLSTDFFWSCIKWLMILLVWGVFAYGTWHEDRKIKKQLDENISDTDAVSILKMLHRRDMQIWLQVSLLLIVVAANDIHHEASLLPPDFFTPPVPAPAVAPAEVKESPDEKYDKILKKNSSSSLPFSNITEFNEQNSKQEAYIDWLKERYESWLVTYYYLEKCKKVNTDDYETIHRALASDLSAAHANESVEGNILLAATGSYKEMYSEIPCDSAHLAATKSMYDANMEQARQAKTQGSADIKQVPAAKAVNTH